MQVLTSSETETGGAVSAVQLESFCRSRTGSVYSRSEVRCEVSSPRERLSGRGQSGILEASKAKMEQIWRVLH